MTRDVRRRRQADDTSPSSSTGWASTAPTSGTSRPYIWSAGGALTNYCYTNATGYMNSPATVARGASSWSKPAEGRRHRHRLPRRRRRGVGRARLPEGPVRHVHRRPVGGAHVPAAQARAGLRHRAVPDRARRLGLDGRRRGHRRSPSAASTWPTPRSSREFLDSPFAQLAMAKAGPDVGADERRPRQEVKTTPYYAVFAQQLQDGKVRPVTPATASWTPTSPRLQEILAGKVSVHGRSERRSAASPTPRSAAVDRARQRAAERRQRRPAAPGAASRRSRRAGAGSRRRTCCSCRPPRCTRSSPSTRSSASSTSASTTGTSSPARRTRSSGFQLHRGLHTTP